jgi:hypothetical protein
MPWSINGTEIFAQLADGFPMETDEVIAWAEDQEEVPEFVLVDLQQNMPRRDWPDRETLLAEVQNYTWTMPDGAKQPVWGGVTQAGMA